MCLSMIMLGIFFEDDNLMDIAERMIQNQASLMTRYPAGFSHWGQALWLLEHQEITVYRGRGAVDYGLGQISKLPFLHLIAAAEDKAGIPVVASKPLQDGLWKWDCDNHGCGLPELVDQ